MFQISTTFQSLSITLVALALVRISNACHAGSRNRRSTDTVTSQVGETSSMRSFFVNCLRTKPRNQSRLS
uniref:Secreted protein n=1 Tax=Ciona savignyi TaxID=51511 RepID=H2ZJA1_CIOSA